MKRLLSRNLGFNRTRGPFAISSINQIKFSENCISHRLFQSYDVGARSIVRQLTLVLRRNVSLCHLLCRTYDPELLTNRQLV